MSRLALLCLALTLAGLPAAAAPRRVTLMPLAEGSGLDAPARKVLGDALLSELRRRSDLTVLSFDDVRAVLTLEQQKQLIGCEEGKCVTQFAGTLGCDELVTASIGQLGRSWVVVVRRIDVTNATAIREINRRPKITRAEQLLDLLPSIVTELFDTSNDTSLAAAPAAAVAIDCSLACRHVLACKGTYIDGDLEALVGKDECLQYCIAGVAIGEDPESPRKKGRREAAWSCTTAATDCLELDKRCDVF